MLYDLEPAKQLTGGPWYSDQELDEEFIQGLRNAALSILDRHNGGPLSADDILEEIIASKITTHPLTVIDIQHILDMLVYDNRIDYEYGAIQRLKLNANHARSIYPYGGAAVRLAYDPIRDSTIGTLTGIGDDKGITISAGKSHISNINLDDTNINDDNDDDDIEDDDIPASKGLIMTLRVGGSAESRIGLGLGYTRRTAHTAALMANNLLLNNLTMEDKHNDDEDYNPHAKEDDDEDNDSDGFRRRKNGKSKVKKPTPSKSKKKSTRYDDDEDEEGDDDDEEEIDIEDEDDDDDDDINDNPRYVLLKRVAGGPNDGSHTDHFTLNPCGVCPVFDQCTPGGIISPETCIYFTNWLEF